MADRGWAITAILTGTLIFPCALQAEEAKDQVPVPPLEQALGQPVSIAVKEVPLADVVKQLQAQTGATILLDDRALADAGAGSDTPVSLDLQQLPLRYALRRLLGPLDLQFVIKSEVILITTVEKAGNELVLRVYDVLDLLTKPGAESSDKLDYDSLIELITTTVQPTTWEEVGGPASISGGVAFGCLTISQTGEVQEQIAHLLAALRKLREANEAKNFKSILCGDVRLNELHTAIEKALDKRQDLAFDRVPLSEVINRLRTETRVNMQLDVRALEDTGVSGDLPISVQLPGISLRSGLRLMLDRYDLAAAVVEGVLLVTSKEKACHELVSIVYPMGDLVPRGDADEEQQIGLATIDRGWLCDDADGAQQVIEVITSAIATSTWGEAGGPGCIVGFEPGMCLVVSQTPEVHEQIAVWFKQLRATLREREKTGVALPKPSAAAAAATMVFSQPKSKDLPVTYEEQRDKAKEGIALVVSTIDSAQWEFGPDQYIRQVGSSIVVRHKPATLRKVSTLFSSLGFRLDGVSSCKGCSSAINVVGHAGGGGGFFNRKDESNGDSRK